ncbi:hypothetical protein PR202_gb01559 [Eleusine coracana subsp. coracana]|uniref:Uncharacterized protein n=1 Tax=Eleusine coracana subsp. coracana TaxID=191504 RepID=A0AAV5DWX7_ELECO|nr:hypothetical protein PR202_gb01559 [Eleusine coracana subsp. coracana]
MPRHGAETPRSKPQSPLRITHDGEFYARLLTKESGVSGNPSFRYYGAGPGAVPFIWESHPGTPKDAYSSSSSSAAVVPAITPPPSYHLRAAAGGGGQYYGSRRHGGKAKYCGYKLNKWIKIGFIATVFRRLAFGAKPPATARSSSSSSPPSAKSSSTRWLFSGSNGPAEEARRDLQEYCCAYEPPTKGTMLCLGVRPSQSSSWMAPVVVNSPAGSLSSSELKHLCAAFRPYVQSVIRGSTTPCICSSGALARDRLPN